MSEIPQKNVYEATPDALDQESQRLRTFDVPTKVSKEVIGALDFNQLLLDIGAGENAELHKFAHKQGASYIALDFRHDPLVDHKNQGALAVRGDAKMLPFTESIADVAHARFVLAHFPDKDDRRAIVSDTVVTLRPGGRAIFIDYDWTVMAGSQNINHLRDFTMAHAHSFNPAYGSTSVSEISEFVDMSSIVEEKRITPPKMQDYGPALALRQITLQGLQSSNADQKFIDEANQMFDDLEVEAALDNPSGYHMPDMVAVVVTKPEK